MANTAKGEIFRAAVASDRRATLKYGDADVVDVSATWDRDAGSVSLFLANRSLEEPAEVTAVLRGLDAKQVLSAQVLTTPGSADRFSANTAEHQPVGLIDLNDAQVEDGNLTVTLPALAWAVITVMVDEV
jgi:alpha-N-arabinofuranosidase